MTMDLVLVWLKGIAAVLALLLAIGVMVWAHRAALREAVREALAGAVLAEREACASAVKGIRVLHQQGDTWTRGADWMQRRAVEVIRARTSGTVVVHKTAAVGPTEAMPRVVDPALGRN